MFDWYIYLKKDRLIKIKIIYDPYMLKDISVSLTTRRTISQIKNFDNQLLQVWSGISKETRLFSRKIYFIINNNILYMKLTM